MSADREPQPIRISLEDAKARFDSGEVTVLDVVDTGTYEKLPYRVKGAVRIAPEDVPDDYGRLPKDRTVLAY